MAKTTKLVRGIHSWIKFQKHQGVESLSIEGKQALADLSQDKNGDTNLILNADKDKVNTVASSVPYLAVSHTTTGTDPNQEKTATISQDLTQFNLGSDGLIDVSKTETSITLYTTKITEKINEVVTNTVTTKETEIKEYVNTTLSTKETELKEFVTEHTAGAVGVSPAYVADEIRKAKEELEAKINEHAGGSSNNQSNGIELYLRSRYYQGNCAKFKLPKVSTGVTSILNVTFMGRSETFYIYGGAIGVYTQNGVTVDFGNAADGVDWTITLPIMSNHTNFEIISYGYPYGKTPTTNWESITIQGDDTYTPPVEERRNTAPVPQ